MVHLHLELESSQVREPLNVHLDPFPRRGETPFVTNHMTAGGEAQKLLAFFDFVPPLLPRNPRTPFQTWEFGSSISVNRLGRLGEPPGCYATRTLNQR